MTVLPSVAARDRTHRWLLPAAAVLTGLVSLALVGFCYFMASLMTYGIFGWTEPSLDRRIVLPLVGIALVAPLGPLVMTLGERRRQWLKIAAATAAAAVLLASLTTWVPVALGWR